MYNTSSEYKSAIRKNSRYFSWGGRIKTNKGNEIPYTSRNIVGQKPKITRSCSGSTALELGSVYASEFTIDLNFKEEIDRYSLYEGEITLYSYVSKSGTQAGPFEVIPMGIFEISEATRASRTISIKAYDYMLRFDKTFVGNKTEKTPFEWLAYACERCDVQLGVLSTVVSKMANGETKFSYTNVDNVETYRDMISYVASLLCAVAMIDRNGRLVVKQFGDTEAIQDIPASWRFNSKIADYITKYSGIYATYKEAGLSEYYHLDNDVDLVYNLGTNPFLQISDSNDREKAVMNILKQLGEVSYVPFEAEVPLDPSYDPMDIFTLSGNQAIGEVSCITEIVLEINGSMSIKCVGENPNLDKAKSRFTKNIEGLIESQEGLYTDLRNGLDRLLFDYNTSKLEVGQDETTIGLISYQLIEDSDLGGHFLCTFRASTTTHLTIRFYDNEAEELYSPIEYDLNAGDTTIGIPHAFIARKQGLHRAAVTAQCEAGTLSIDIRKALFTIDGGYLATRELDVGMDMQDLAIRQVEDDNGPDEIWIIGLDEGEVMVRKRKYEESNPYIGFDGVINLGPGRAAAIEFDGEWVERDDDEKFTIETEDWPWFFWTDEEDVLWGQKGEDEENRIQIATDVVSVKACKGYSSLEYIEQDQGLVVLYRKESGVFYRQFAYDSTFESKLWGDEIKLLDGDWTHSDIHRLNDYRLGFELTSEEKNLWMYTKRTYVGQSGGKTKIQSPSALDSTILLYAPSDANLDVNFDLEMSDDLKIFTIHSNRKLVLFKNDLREILSFNDSIIWDYGNDNMVSSVKILYIEDENRSDIVITLKESPKKLITEIRFASDYRFQAEVEDYGRVVCPAKVFTVDTTVYRTLNTETESFELSFDKSGFELLTIEERRTEEDESFDLGFSLSNFDYILIGERRTEEEEADSLGFGILSFDYKQVGQSPI